MSSKISDRRELITIIGKALKEIEFEKIGSKNLKFNRRLNSETEIFLFPGIGSTNTHLYLEPIVGLYNKILKNRIMETDRYDEDPRVCHTFLGQIDGIEDIWGKKTLRFYINDKPSAKEVVLLLIKAVKELAIPLFEKLDSTEKVIELLKNWKSSGRERWGYFVILDREWKLSLLVAH